MDGTPRFWALAPSRSQIRDSGFFCLVAGALLPGLPPSHLLVFAGSHGLFILPRANMAFYELQPSQVFFLLFYRLAPLPQNQVSGSGYGSTLNHNMNRRFQGKPVRPPGPSRFPPKKPGDRPKCLGCIAYLGEGTLHQLGSPKYICIYIYIYMRQPFQTV